MVVTPAVQQAVMCAGLPTVVTTGAMKRGCGDAAHPAKMCYVSFMVMDLLGPSIGSLSLELHAYQQDMSLLVNHSLGMLKVHWRLLSEEAQHATVSPAGARPGTSAAT
jgi:hypothetical protein